MNRLTESKLSLAACRIHRSPTPAFPSDTGTSSAPIVPCHGPILIASRVHGVSCCLLEPPNDDPSDCNGPIHAFYDDRVQLVPWSHSNQDVRVCMDFVRKNTRKQLRIQDLEDKGSLPTSCHRATIYPEQPNTEDGSFCGFSLPDSAIPLLSISLRLKKSQGESESALCLLRRKRQLACLLVVFWNGNITTHVKLTDGGDSLITYQVESVTARNSNPSPKGFIYIILPSTMITLLPATASNGLVRYSLNTATELGTPVSKHLIQTVRCLRGATIGRVSKSFLLSGPPGVGKTYSVRQAYNVCKAEGPTLLFSLGSLLGSGDGPGEVSQRLERSFQRAAKACQMDDRCVAILFIDECDALLSSHAVAGMLASLLDRAARDADGWQRILVVAATNLPDRLPAPLRRPGRLDREIRVAPPTSVERMAILKALMEATTDMATLGFEELRDLAEECVGYVAADLVALLRRVKALALEEDRDSIDLDLFRKAMMDVRASALRDSILLAPPKTQWSDIAGDPGGAQKILRQALEWPRTRREAFHSLGLSSPKGILLYGPPGCAKTTLARAAAGAAGSSFLAFAPSDVYASSYVGEAESTVRNAFRLARSANPCILFFDEIDAIIGNEGGEGNHGMNRSGGGSSAESRVLSTFLNEMDGVDGSWEDGVIVLAATNRPWTLDKALLRSGRFDKAIYVPPPDYEGRLSIFKMFCKASSLHAEAFELLASHEVSGSMTGAEIVGACQAAGMRALKDMIEKGAEEKSVEVTLDYLLESLSSTQPLLSEPGYLDGYLTFERSRLRV